MKAIYAFEEELIEKYGDELESHCVEYGADKLKEADRRELSGMLWALRSLEHGCDEYVSEENDNLLEKMVREIKAEAAKELIDRLLCDIREFTVGMIYIYEEEEREEK